MCARAKAPSHAKPISEPWRNTVTVVFSCVRSKVHGGKKTLMPRPKRVDPEAPETTRC